MHGVTCLTRGVRLSLFLSDTRQQALRAPAPESDLLGFSSSSPSSSSSSSSSSLSPPSSASPSWLKLGAGGLDGAGCGSEPLLDVLSAPRRFEGAAGRATAGDGVGDRWGCFEAARARARP